MRLPAAMLEQVDALCEKNGNCRTSFIKSAIEAQLDNKKEEQKPQKITVTPIGDDEPFRPSKGVQTISI